VKLFGIYLINTYFSEPKKDDGTNYAVVEGMVRGIEPQPFHPRKNQTSSICCSFIWWNGILSYLEVSTGLKMGSSIRT
jgi:hypothetical protein